MTFQKGVSGNPAGRAKGTRIARTTAISAIFGIFNKPGNQAKFQAMLQKEFDQDPGFFYKFYVEPLQPKKIEMGIDLKAQILSAQIDLTKLDTNDLKVLQSLVGKAEIPVALEAGEGEIVDESY